MARAIQISLSHFSGPQSHLLAAETPLPSLFSDLHWPSQCICQHLALGLPWADGGSRLIGEQGQDQQEGSRLACVLVGEELMETVFLRHSDGGGKVWGCRGRRVRLLLVSLREQ